MKFSKKFLVDEGGKTISDGIIQHGRWSVTHERIFEHEGRFFKTVYRVGATEMQDESPYEYEKDEVECVEVKPVEKTVIMYEDVKEN